MFEVNLVPDVKAELLKAQKMRNFIIYVSILVGAVCVGVIAVLGGIVGGQNIALGSQDAQMKEKSDCIMLGKQPTSGTTADCATISSNLNLNLTIQDQLGKLSDISENRRVLSRVFGILDLILPTGDDQVTISELSVNLPTSTLSFDGQADSTSDIDYRALEVFKKTVELSSYDYGRYIDIDGGEVPSFCIDEDIDTTTRKLWGIYHAAGTGCEDAASDETEEDTSTGDETPETDPTDGDDATDTPPATEPATPTIDASCAGLTFPTIIPAPGDICIKRDMTAAELETAETEHLPFFRSECISEDGTNECLLVPNPVLIRESSNGRNSAGSLVLRFSASVSVASDVFSFANKHMRVISPTRQNVTDSYVQVRNMFTEEARDCAPNDLECINAGGGEN